MERRNTMQKDLVRQAVLTMKRHVTAEEVYEYVKKEHPGIGKGTVYRNLGILSEEGSIRRVEVPNGPDRFDFTLRNHYHVRCVRCGEVFVPDLYSGVVKTVNYLIFRGHKHILFVPPLRYNMYMEKGYRERGYRDALEENGLPYDEEYICKNNDTMEAVLSQVFDLVFSRSKEERATAIIAGNDFIAASIMQYVKKLGMKIPEDLAVIGTDNNFIAEMVSPTLTSIDFSKEEFSEKLVDTLLSLLKGEHPKDCYLPVSLKVRESA